VVSSPPAATLQAYACWRWSNFIAACNTEGKPVLRINMDETCLKLHVPARPGIVFEPVAKHRKQLLRKGRGPDLGTRRAAVTLLAFACDDERAQRLLPQIFLLNERVISKADLDAVRARSGSRILMTRRTSGWVNAKFMVEVVDVLALCLADVLGSRHVVLHLDACKAHSHIDVLRAVSKAGIFVHFVPASTTAWLQPLDVSVFSKFKGWVVGEVERLRLASADGVLGRPEVLDVYRRGVARVIQGQSWARAFGVTGLSDQSGLGTEIAARLGAFSPLTVPRAMPSYEDLAMIFPRGANVPVEELFEVAVSAERSKRAIRLALSAKLPGSRSRL
jgi:hypothetical protein